MIVKVKDMTRDVRIAMDMNRNDGLLISELDLDTLNLDVMISNLLPDAIRDVETEAPLKLLDGGETLKGDIFFSGNGSGFIILPDDFMRLLIFRMSDWSRAVTEAIDYESPTYQLQSSKWSGIRGTWQKPVCAVVRRSEGRVLEFYSSRSEDAYVTQGTYLRYPSIDSGGGIEVCRGCYRASVYRCASMVLSILGDQLSGSMTELSKIMLK